VLSEIAQTPAISDALQSFVRDKQRITEQQLQLCRVAAPTFFEQKRAEWMLGQFRNFGWIARIDRAGNVIAHPIENREGPYVALTAHLDTVLAPRNNEEISIDPDGRLHGPGVSDNGAGLAALLAIARLVPVIDGYEDLFGSLVLIANVGEEGEGNLSGMRYLCRQSSTGSRIQSFLILDGPNTDHITSQALASRRFDVSITGSRIRFTLWRARSRCSLIKSWAPGARVRPTTLESSKAGPVSIRFLRRREPRSTFGPRARRRWTRFRAY